MAVSLLKVCIFITIEHVLLIVALLNLCSWGSPFGVKIGLSPPRSDLTAAATAPTEPPTALDRDHAGLGTAQLQPPSRSPLWPTDPVPCRDDLSYVANRFFHKTGEAAEIGVFQGQFSAKTLQVWKGNLTMVDTWQFRPRENAHDREKETKAELGNPDKNWEDDKVNLANMEAARSNVQFAGERAKLLRAFSAEAVAKYRDGFFDWVYIDALHTREAVLNDLELWYPKVRSGGLVSGDDYGEDHDAELVGAERWKKTLGPVALAYSWGVISALSNFTKAIGAELHITWLHDCYEFPAWYFVKP